MGHTPLVEHEGIAGVDAGDGEKNRGPCVCVFIMFILHYIIIHYSKLHRPGPQAPHYSVVDEQPGKIYGRICFWPLIPCSIWTLSAGLLVQLW